MPCGHGGTWARAGRLVSFSCDLPFLTLRPFSPALSSFMGRLHTLSSRARANQGRQDHGICGRSQARSGLRDVPARPLPHPGTGELVWPTCWGCWRDGGFCSTTRPRPFPGIPPCQSITAVCVVCFYCFGCLGSVLHEKHPGEWSSPTSCFSLLSSCDPTTNEAAQTRTRPHLATLTTTTTTTTHHGHSQQSKRQPPPS